MITYSCLSGSGCHPRGRSLQGYQLEFVAWLCGIFLVHTGDLKWHMWNSFYHPSMLDEMPGHQATSWALARHISIPTTATIYNYMMTLFLLLKTGTQIFKTWTGKICYIHKNNCTFWTYVAIPLLLLHVCYNLHTWVSVNLYSAVCE